MTTKLDDITYEVLSEEFSEYDLTIYFQKNINIII